MEWGIDLQSEHERYLTEELVGRPVVVMNYPKDIKAFYMRPNDDGRTVAAMDVLAPGIGEIIGGCQREERLDVLDAPHRRDGPRTATTTGGTATCAATAPSPTPASASASSGRSSTPPGMANIRDVIPFPRTPEQRRLLSSALTEAGGLVLVHPLEQVPGLAARAPGTSPPAC